MFSKHVEMQGITVDGDTPGVGKQSAMFLNRIKAMSLTITSDHPLDPTITIDYTGLVGARANSIGGKREGSSSTAPYCDYV